MVIPCLYYLAKFPKLINMWLDVIVIELKFMSDGIKADFRHNFSQAIGAWICLLIKGGDTPEVLTFPYRSGVH